MPNRRVLGAFDHGRQRYDRYLRSDNFDAPSAPRRLPCVRATLFINHQDQKRTMPYCFRSVVPVHCAGRCQRKMFSVVGFPVTSHHPLGRPPETRRWSHSTSSRAVVLVAKSIELSKCDSDSKAAVSLISGGHHDHRLSLFYPHSRFHRGPYRV